MGLGAIGAYLRKMPTVLWNWLLKRVTLSVSITEQSKEIQQAVSLWLDINPAFKNNRRLDAKEKMSHGKRKLMLSLAEGTHWFWYEGLPMRITFVRAEDSKGWGESVRSEKITIQTVGRDKNKIKNLLEKLQADMKKYFANVNGFFVYSQDYWERVGNLPKRSLDSVVLDGAIKGTVVNDIKEFLDAEEWYDNVHIPYRRGYLLHGLPGTGKSSLINAIANELVMDIYQLNLSSMRDERFSEAMRSVPNNSIVVFEDIDCAFTKRTEIKPEAEKNQPQDSSDVLFGLTLSGFLNAMDGLMAPRGILVFMTTNHVQKLDPAMIRPGRCDVHVEFKEITAVQKLELYERFFPADPAEVAVHFCNAVEVTTPAELQEVLMLEKNRRTSANKKS